MSHDTSNRWRSWDEFTSVPRTKFGTFSSPPPSDNSHSYSYDLTPSTPGTADSSISAATGRYQTLSTTTRGIPDPNKVRNSIRNSASYPTTLRVIPNAQPSWTPSYVPTTRAPPPGTSRSEPPSTSTVSTAPNGTRHPKDMSFGAGAVRALDKNGHLPEYSERAAKDEENPFFRVERKYNTRSEPGLPSQPDPGGLTGECECECERERERRPDPTGPQPMRPLPRFPHSAQSSFAHQTETDTERLHGRSSLPPSTLGAPPVEQGGVPPQRFASFEIATSEFRLGST